MIASDPGPWGRCAAELPDDVATLLRQAILAERQVVLAALRIGPRPTRYVIDTLSRADGEASVAWARLREAATAYVAETTDSGRRAATRGTKLGDEA